MRRPQLKVMLLFALVAFAAPAYSQTEPPRRTVVQTNQQTSQPQPSKQTGITQISPAPAEYNLGLMVKKVAALETQVASLQKQNESLGGQLSAQQKLTDSLTSQNKTLLTLLKAHGASLTGAQQTLQALETKFNQLDSSLSNLNSSYQSHTHYIPMFGEQALSSIAGMQEIANKAGVGYVKPQWEKIRILFRNTNSNATGTTGTIVK